MSGFAAEAEGIRPTQASSSASASAGTVIFLVRESEVTGWT